MKTDTENSPKGNTVLIVDDEVFIQDLVGMMIESLGYAFVTAADGEEAVQCVLKHRKEIFIVLCDLSMPGMDGWQTISALRVVAPQLPVILTSGYAIDEHICNEHPDKPWAIMSKPYLYEELEMRLRLARAGDENQEQPK